MHKNVAYLGQDKLLANGVNHECLYSEAMALK